MKKVLTAVTATGLAAGTAMAGASGTLDFANAHIFRGTTVLDEFVVQPSIELSGFGMPEEWGAVAAGAWGSYAPFYDGDLEYNNIYETDWYVNYTLPQFVDGLDLYLGFTEYQYSGFLGFAGEREINIGAGYEIAGFALGASGNFMIDDEVLATDGQSYFDFSADYALDVSEDFDIGVGALISYMIQGDGNAITRDDGLNHLELYGAVGYDLGEIWSVGFSLAYIGQLDDNVLPDSIGGIPGTGYDVGVVGMFSVGCEM